MKNRILHTPLLKIYRRRDWESDAGHRLDVVIGHRPDMWQYPRDAGSHEPVVLHLWLRWGQSATAREDQRPWPEGFTLRFGWRSDVRLIAERLAGGVE